MDVADAERAVLNSAGKMLARGSSHWASGPSSRRWTEIAISRLDVGGYVVHEIGRSIVDGETDRERVTEAATGRLAFDAIAARRRITALDSEVFGAAAAADAEFAASLGDAHDVEDLVGADGIPGVSPLIADAMVREIVLDRDGDRALRFRGIELGWATSRTPSAGSPRSWMEVAIFRTVDGRYAAQKARYEPAEPAVPSKSSVTVVSDGLGALQALLRRGSDWAETAVLAALREAAQKDEHFRSSLGDLLTGSNVRRILPDVRALTRTERSVLEVMAGGAVIEAEANRPDPQLRRWVRAGDDVVDVGLPHPRVFITLSRDRFIGLEHSSPRADGLSEWTITDRGRRALENTPPSSRASHCP